MRYLLSLFLLLVVSCGGGGSDSATQNPISGLSLLPPDTSTISYYNTSQYTTHLNTAGVVDAWNYIRYNVTANDPGQNIKILVTDSAIAADHNSFANRISNIQTFSAGSAGNTNYTQLTSAEGMANARLTPGSTLTELTTVSEHGTAVSSVIAGNNVSTFGSGIHAGVAWGATIGFLQLEQNRLDGDRNIDGYNTMILSQNTLSNIITANNYKVVNMSLGGPENVFEQNAINTAIINNDVLLAIATGNNLGNHVTATSYQNPEYPAGFAGTLNGTGKMGVILAVAGSQDTTNNSQAEFNFCGLAKAYCLAAQNTNVHVASSSGVNSYGIERGTSFAAPLVSGSAAVIAGAYPTLTMKQVGDFILRGATPKYATWETIANADQRQVGGSYVTSISLRANANDGLVSDVYGYGELNLLASAQLVQATRATSSYSFAESTIQSSPVIGDAIAVIQDATINTYDDYGTYKLNIANNINIINSLGISDKIAMSLRHKINNNFASANIGNSGYVAFSGIIPQDNSTMTNVKIMAFSNQSGIFDPNSSQFNNMTFGFAKNIAGFNFSFKENYNAQNFDLVYNLENYNPFLEYSFNGNDTRKFDVSKRFGSWNFGISTLVGRSANFNTLNGITPEQSRNFANTASVEYKKNANTLGIEIGILREANTFLGTYSSGAFSFGNNNTTTFIKTKGLFKITGNIGLFGAFSIGQTQMGQNADSLISNVSNIASRALLAGIRFDKFFGGNLELTYSQPLKSISGNANFLTSNGNAMINLVPIAKQQDFGISFTKQSRDASVSLQGVYTLNRNNVITPPSFGAFITARKSL